MVTGRADESGPTSQQVTVVVMTRNRCDDLRRTLPRLRDRPDPAPIIVADNGSHDGTREMLAMQHPDVRVLDLGDNVGVAARNAAVRAATTPYIAFNDDDSWWAPGALARVAGQFDRHPRLGGLTAHVVVEPEGRDDPTSLAMANSPLVGEPDVPGTAVLGFLACATAVRRSAFLDVGGFEERFHFGGEEQLLAVDLAREGWAVRFDPALRVHHAVSTQARDPAWRRRREVRNGLWATWLRRPIASAVRRTWTVLRDAEPKDALVGLTQAMAGGAWVLRERSVISPELDRELHQLDPR